MVIYNSFYHPKYEFSHQIMGFHRIDPIEIELDQWTLLFAAEKWGTWKYLEKMLYDQI